MASNQLGIKEPCNIVASKYSSTGNGDFIAYFDYAENASLETTADKLEISGGIGNFRLLSWDHSKKQTVKISLPIVDLKFLSFIAGKDLSVGATNVPKFEKLTASESNTLILSETPVTGTLKIYAKENDRDDGEEQTAGATTNPNEYTITGTTVSLNATSGAEGNQFMVYYDYSAAATTKTITFTADKFAGYMRLTGDGEVTDLVTGLTQYVKFDFKKCKPMGNYNITMSGTAATMLEMEFDLFYVEEGSDKVYCTMHEMV